MRYRRLMQGARAHLARELRVTQADNGVAKAPPANAAMPVPNQALPGGYQLLNYRIDRQISRGGFSIVYRAFDETGAPVPPDTPGTLYLRGASAATGYWSQYAASRQVFQGE